jgi:hypothetical protein
MNITAKTEAKKLVKYVTVYSFWHCAVFFFFTPLISQKELNSKIYGYITGNYVYSPAKIKPFMNKLEANIEIGVMKPDPV